MTRFGRSKIADSTAPCANGFRPNRRSLLSFGAGAALAATGLRPARAQDYPARPVQVLVPFAGGSASDVITRILLNRMSTSLGQAFVVDNRPGATILCPRKHVEYTHRSRLAALSDPGRRTILIDRGWIWPSPLCALRYAALRHQHQNHRRSGLERLSQTAQLCNYLPVQKRRETKNAALEYAKLRENRRAPYSHRLSCIDLSLRILTHKPR